MTYTPPDVPFPKHVLQQAEAVLQTAHSANVAREQGPVFGFDTYAQLSGIQVVALLKELQDLRSKVQPDRDPPERTNT